MKAGSGVAAKPRMCRYLQLRQHFPGDHRYLLVNWMAQPGLQHLNALPELQLQHLRSYAGERVKQCAERNARWGMFISNHHNSLPLWAVESLQFHAIANHAHISLVWVQ